MIDPKADLVELVSELTEIRSLAMCGVPSWATDDTEFRNRINAILAEVARREREACAVLVEDFDEIATFGGYYREDNARETLRNAAVAIRARGGA